jgi:UDP-glucose 4-epimerase
VRDKPLLDQVFSKFKVQSVLHFAGLKAVGESVSQPLRYFDNNVHGSQVLLQACAAAGVFNVVFSSSYAFRQHTLNLEFLASRMARFLIQGERWISQRSSGR